MTTQLSDDFIRFMVEFGVAPTPREGDLYFSDSYKNPLQLSCSFSSIATTNDDSYTVSTVKDRGFYKW